MNLSLPSHKTTRHWADLLWDLWCVASIIGIWPRFIEPWLLCTTHLKLPIDQLPRELDGLRILHFSDLHLYPSLSSRFLTRLRNRISSFKPDLILFTGDFLCYSDLNDPARLENFFCSLSAPNGCFAIFGNHDYAQFVSVNDAGEYDVLEKQQSSISRGLRRLFQNPTIAKKTTLRALATKEHQSLTSLIEKTPFKLLNNQSMLIPVKGSFLNICGLGEYMLGRCLPEKAFEQYDRRYPGIILTHNPDSIPSLLPYPGDLILAGHTHGGQINIPWIKEKFVLMENKEFLKGLLKVENKWVYVSRGVGSVMPFRWFSPPEIVYITLEKSDAS